MRTTMKSAIAAAAILLASALAMAQADWTQRTPTTSPSARFAPAMAQFGSYTLLFGGLTPNAPVSPPNDDTWLWDGTNWIKITSFGLFGTGSHPAARGRASMAYDSANDEVILFGGVGVNGTILGDTWVFHVVTNQLLHRSFYEWDQISQNVSPPARQQGVMDYNPTYKQTVLNGGIGADAGTLRDTWTFVSSGPDGPQWRQVTTTQPIAPQRFSTAMAKCGGVSQIVGRPQANDQPQQMLEFGGFGGPSTSLGDSWTLDGGPTTLHWDGPLTFSPAPPARFDHGMAYYPVSNRVVMYGGDNNHNAHLFNDTWNALCGNSSPGWTQATPAHNPGMRESMGMATGPDGNTVVLFGGLKENSFSELQTNGETWTWGRRATCLPTDGEELEEGDEVNCLFDKIPGVRFGEWDASGFGPRFSDRQKVTFQARGRGPAAITAYWSDANGSQSLTYNYTVSGRHHHH